MRLLTYRTRDGDRVGLAVDGQVLAVDDLLEDGPWTMQAVVEGGRSLLDRLGTAAARAIEGGTPAATPLAGLDLVAPLARPGKIIAVGRNYREHAAEEGADVQPDPVIFTKFSSAIVGHGADIVWAADASVQVDHEAELAVVIGSHARDVARAAALDAVFGYTCLDDVSARDLQVQDGQWVRAKSLDTFCPMGPWIVTADEIPDPSALAIRCTVNGEVRQAASTGDMIHDVRSLIAFCSRFFTLEPGDVIATGTPGGVGAFRDPPVFLADGDVVAVSIEGIGTLENRCVVVGAR
jgi:2-keto-4-pentenoate hydratase/2-oxohepta-3-ene-1,7-dioic acid hydratase in catechol pathway